MVKTLPKLNSKLRLLGFQRAGSTTYWRDRVAADVRYCQVIAFDSNRFLPGYTCWLAIYVYELSEYIHLEPWDRPSWKFAHWDLCLEALHPELGMLTEQHDAILSALADNEIVPILDAHLDVRSLFDRTPRIWWPGMLVFIADLAGAEQVIHDLRSEATNSIGRARNNVEAEIRLAESILETALALHAARSQP